MAADPRDVGELQKALNDASGRASALWITFVTFELYLAIAFGSVGHRELFLETPIKLPVLNVELPLVGFFVVAPTVLIIFHFYVFLQLFALAGKTQDYNALLERTISLRSDRRYMQQRLDPFPMVQILAGPEGQRTGLSGLSLLLVAWLTLVAAPIVVLLQGQIIFLPYHREWVVWLQRSLMAIDLVLVWLFWFRIMSQRDRILHWIPAVPRGAAGAIAAVFVLVFSIAVVTFPGELAHEKLPYVRLVPNFGTPAVSGQSPNGSSGFQSLHQLLFAGAVDEVKGRPQSLLSNRLVLTDQNLVETDKLQNVTVSRSLRGRDLREAVFSRADLRKVDFTGAMLNGASFVEAKLEKAKFDCGSKGDGQDRLRRKLDRRWPDDGCTWLIEASFEKANLSDASLEDALLIGANFYEAKLQGARLSRANLQGAWLHSARLEGATLVGADMRAASLGESNMTGALAEEADFRGADLNNAILFGVSLGSSNLTAASLRSAMLNGAWLGKAVLDMASLEGARIWRVSGDPEFELALLGPLELEHPWNDILKTSNYHQWLNETLRRIPEGRNKENAIDLLKWLNPDGDGRYDSLDPEYWIFTNLTPAPKGAFEQKVASEFLKLICSSRAPYYVARGLNRGYRIDDVATMVDVIRNELRRLRNDKQACSAAAALDDQDFEELLSLIAVRTPLLAQ